MGLRLYQVGSKKYIKLEWGQGNRRVILCIPTGGGKTVIFCSLTLDAIAKGSTVMIVVDRSELLEQAQKKLISLGVVPSLITSGKKYVPGQQVYIATVQTLIKRQVFPDVNLIIIDEAHKQCFDPLLQRPEYTNTFFAGMTATPLRTGKMTQLSSIWDALVEPVTIPDLIKQEYLAPAITYGATMDMDDIKTQVKDGVKDYHHGEMYEMFNKSKLYAGCVDQYLKFSPGEKAICFNINVQHSIRQRDEFRARGISAEHVDGKTPKAQRRKLVKAYAEGHFKVLCNCDLFTTGFDDWSIQAVIVNLATMSLIKWLQMDGRGSRVTPDEFKDVPGYIQKKHFKIIDMGGNTFRLGFWEQPRTYNLTHTRKNTLGVAPIKTCPEDEVDVEGTEGCGAMLHASLMVCPQAHCGFIFERKEKPSIHTDFEELVAQFALPEHLAGKSIEEFTDDELEEYRVEKGHHMGWAVRHMISRHGRDGINRYAAIKGYKQKMGFTCLQNAQPSNPGL